MNKKRVITNSSLTKSDLWRSPNAPKMRAPRPGETVWKVIARPDPPPDWRPPGLERPPSAGTERR
jgi:hypothetical protein